MTAAIPVEPSAERAGRPDHTPTSAAPRRGPSAGPLDRPVRGGPAPVRSGPPDPAAPPPVRSRSSMGADGTVSPERTDLAVDGGLAAVIAAASGHQRAHDDEGVRSGRPRADGSAGDGHAKPVPPPRVTATGSTLVRARGPPHRARRPFAHGSRPVGRLPRRAGIGRRHGASNILGCVQESLEAWRQTTPTRSTLPARTEEGYGAGPPPPSHAPPAASRAVW